MNENELAEQVIAKAIARNITITTVESCTGGLIAAALTSVSGASAVFETGFVTYSNQAKIQLVQVRAATLDAHGAVSVQTAREMAQGGLDQLAPKQIAIAVTGIAGPGGGSIEKPVGTVCFGLGQTGADPKTWAMLFDKAYASAGREGVRQASVQFALERVLEAIQGQPVSTKG